MLTSGRGKTNVEADVRLDQSANYSYTLGKGPRWVTIRKMHAEGNNSVGRNKRPLPA